MHMRRPVLVLAASLALSLAATFGITGSADAAGRLDLAGSVPGWARAANLCLGVISPARCPLEPVE
jgi:hypothetical protein